MIEMEGLKMKNYNFDKHIFNRQCALPLTILQFVFIIGFIFIVIAIILGETIHVYFSIPTFVIIFLFISFIAFPIITVLKMGYRKKLKLSTLSIQNNVIIYNMLITKEWTGAGYNEEHHVFIIHKIDHVKITKRYIETTGKIHLKVIYNNHLLKEKDVPSIKIPRTYLKMEEILQAR